MVKRADPTTPWIWGAFGAPGAILHVLNQLWCARNRQDEYIGTLINAYLAGGGKALGVKAGESYVDVGTLNGYREAMGLLADRAGDPPIGIPSKVAHHAG